MLFDEHGELCGRYFAPERRTELVRDAEEMDTLAFCGVHVISPRLLGMMSETGVFSIIQTYLHLAARDEKIMAFRAGNSYWRDLGTLESLKQAEAVLRSGVVSS